MLLKQGIARVNPTGKKYVSSKRRSDYAASFVISV